MRLLAEKGKIRKKKKQRMDNLIDLRVYGYFKTAFKEHVSDILLKIYEKRTGGGGGEANKMKQNRVKNAFCEIYLSNYVGYSILHNSF